ncbi:MAG: FdhF/YdeP family oxidoreductase [Acidimicrobiales bacterium]
MGIRPEEHAAGLKAAAVAARRAQAQMGVRRSIRTLLEVNQPDGFDCPGCAWPEPHETSRLEFCENGAKAVAEEATRRRATRELFARHSISDLARHDEHWLGQQGRLTEPMHLAPGGDHYEPIAWDDALDLVAGHLRGLPSPNAAAFYTSGRTSNEAAFVYQLFARALGTNNLPDCSNMCHESSGSALTETIGIGKGTVSLDDIHHAELIFVVGQNPGTNHPRMLNALETATANGARIVAVNPLPEAGLLEFRDPKRPGKRTKLADLFLQIRVNGDLALFAGLNRLLLDSDAIDHAFVDRYCTGFDTFRNHAATRQWDDIEEATGLGRAVLDEVAGWAAASERIIVCWAMGLTQHRNSVATIREIVNFILLRGAIGKPGAGLCPVRGHSNVQGDRTMGIWERPPAAFLARLRDEFGFDPPTGHGYDTVETIRAMRDGRVRVFFAVGGNFAAAAPDTEATEDALRGCDLTVHVSTKLNRSHLVTGREALVLPCLGRTERDQPVSVEDSMGMVHLSRGSLDPASSQLRSEVAIVCDLAARTLPASPIPWAELAGDYDRIRGHIERVVEGFDDFNRRVREPGGFALPHGPRDSRTFATTSGKAVFTVNPLALLRVPPGRLLLQTVRSHDQYNTTIYGFDDRYRGVRSRTVVLVHPDDLAERGLTDGDVVDVISEHGGVERRARHFTALAYPTARGCCAAYFPEANVLVSLDSTAEVSNTPASKSIIVRLEPTR